MRPKRSIARKTSLSRWDAKHSSRAAAGYCRLDADKTHSHAASAFNARFQRSERASLSVPVRRFNALTHSLEPGQAPLDARCRAILLPNEPRHESDKASVSMSRLRRKLVSFQVGGLTLFRTS
jgi:hypothetical protein